MWTGWPCDLVPNKNSIGFDKQNSAFVREPSITAHSLDRIALFGRDPLFNFRIGRRSPAERARGNGLIRAINANRIMRGRAAEPVSPDRFGNVCVSAGVDQDLLFSKPNNQAQRIGMAVAGRA